MKRSDILTISLLFLVVLPVLCVYFELYQSIYYGIYSTACRYWYHLSWKGDGGLYLDNVDYSVRLIKELVTENAGRVKDAERIVKNLNAAKRTDDGAWMMKGNHGWSQKSDSNVTDGTGLMEDVTDEALRMTSSKVHVALVIISCRRETVYDEGLSFRYQPRYLIQNVASLASLLSERWKNIATAKVIFSLSICSVTEGDLTAEEKYLSRLFTVKQFQAISGTTFGPYHDVMAWAYEKEKRDYVNCLRHSASIKQADYMVLVEDDAIARPEALDVIENLVLRRMKQINNLHSNIKQSQNNRITNNKDYNQIKNQKILYRSDVNNAISKQKSNIDSSLEPDENCYYVKLYHPSRHLGYLSLERERIPQLLAIAAVLGTVLHCCHFWQRKLNVINLANTPTAMNNNHGGVQSSGDFRKGESLSVVGRLCLRVYCRTLCFDIYVSSWRYFYGLFAGNLVTSRYRWLQTCLICGVVALLVGRPHMDGAWRRLMSPHLHYTVPDVHCCTQAVLYSRQAALQLIDYMHHVRCNDTWHKDDAIFAWAQGDSNDAMTTEGQDASMQYDYSPNPKQVDAEGASDDYFSDFRNVNARRDERVKIVSVDGHLIQPNIFKHIGLWSSLRKGFIDPGRIRE